MSDHGIPEKVEALESILVEKGYVHPETTRITVHDSTAEVRYLVVPMRPEGTAELDEEALAALVTRDGMIGTALL